MACTVDDVAQPGGGVVAQVAVATREAAVWYTGILDATLKCTRSLEVEI
jgi:hypothetical protein